MQSGLGARLNQIAQEFVRDVLRLVRGASLADAAEGLRAPPSRRKRGKKR